MIYLLCFVFFLSGSAALIFEALWFQLLGLGLGNSIWASSIVLSSFMAGLAIGNGLAYKISLKLRKPARIYAYLECIIGGTGLAVVLLFPALNTYLGRFFQDFSEQTIAINFFRVVISFAFLLVPSTAMGATLPILVKALYPKVRNFGQVLGILYGCNTLGAVAGVLINELVLVRHLGLSGSAWAAASFNATAALLVLLYVKTEATPATPDRQPERISSQAHAWDVIRYLLISFMTGFVILALEVFWLRFILLFYNAYSLNFAIMLATVLSGISVGGFFASRWFKRRPDAHLCLPAVYLLMALFVTVNYRIFNFLLRHYGNAGTAQEFTGLALMYVCFVFPVTFLSGIAFTMLGKSLELEINEESKATSILTVANTTGGMVGALFAAFYMIPDCGIEKSFFISAVVFGVLAPLAYANASMPKTRRRMVRSAAAIVVVSILTYLFPFGMMNTVYIDVAVEHYIAAGEKRVAVKESVLDTIQYFQKDFLGMPYYHRLVTNNYPMSNTKLYCKRYMKLFVYWPIAVLKEARDALLICYGCGTTAKALVDTKTLTQIDIVDMSKDIIELSGNIFKNPSASPLNDPRVHFHIEDGRFYLLKSHKQYDLITAEPPPLRVKGVVNLYTKEYFQLIHDRLKEGGVVTYWLPVYQVNVSDAKSIIKGFSEVFENCSLWMGSGFEWMLVGVKPANRSHVSDAFAEQWRDPETALEMRALGFPGPEQLGSLFIADGERLQRWIAGSLPLVDNYPYRLNADYLVKWDESLPVYRELMNSEASRNNFVSSPYIKEIWPAEMIREAEKHFMVREPVIDFFLPGNYRSDDTIRFIDRIFQEERLHDYILWAFYMDAYKREIADKAYSSDPQSPLNNSYHHLFLAADAVAQRDYGAAVQHLHQAIASANDKYEQLHLSLIRIYLLLMMQNSAAADRECTQYIDFIEQGKSYRTRQVQDLKAFVDSQYVR